MKLMRLGAAGSEKPALLLDDTTALDVSPLVGDFDRAFFETGGMALLHAITERERERLPRIDLDGVRIGAPVARPGHVVAIGLNYAEHASETNESLPSEPIVFSKAPNTVVGPYDDIIIPPGSVKTDWEVELGVVVGRRCSYLSSPTQALEHIAGFCTSNDVSERSFQLERGGQWVKGKSSETFNPLGPWLVSPDEVLDVQDLELGLTVNGETMQHSTTRHMIFSVAHLVWYLSQFMVLDPGDLINTGTPSGVGLGRKPPRYLAPGDVVDAWVEGLGRQRNTCVAFTRAPATSARPGSPALHP